MTEQIQQLKKMIDESTNIVFFGGAGVSTVRLLPALGITKEQADVFIAAFKGLMAE